MKRKYKHRSQLLNNYSLLSGAFLMISPIADAQIMYSDIDPDIWSDAILHYDFDMDSNSVLDFNLKFDVKSHSNTGPAGVEKMGLGERRFPTNF